MSAHLLYVADPMCSWCYGFGPELATLAEGHGLGVRVLMGGLRPGPSAQVLDDRLRRYLRDTWTKISEITGRPFDLGFLDREGWVYDTELPARAVVVVRELAPDVAWPFFERVQRAFYAEGVDITDPAVYPDLVAEFPDVDGAAFEEALTGDDSRKAAWRDFAEARRMGVEGFPALFLRDGVRVVPLAFGYRKAEDITPLVSSALTPVGEVCVPGEDC